MDSDRRPAVAGLVLAAGRSSRMGRPKALLDAGGPTFLAAILARLHAAEAVPVVVVVAAGDRAVAEEAARAGAQVATNPDPDRGMLSSLWAGLDLIEPGPAAALLLWPVDHPAVGAATVREVLTAFARTRAPVVIPCHRARPGHPTLFARSTFAEIRASPLATGARAVVDAHAADRALIEVEDPGILADVDTPEDYLRLRAGAGSCVD